MQDNRNTSIPALLNRSSTSAIGPDLPVKQTQAWNQPQMDVLHSSMSGSMPRTVVRFPEDVTALADRDGSLARDKDGATTVKKSVTKTYHTLKDLISSKFKKDAADQNDELNNVTSMLHQSNLEQGGQSAGGQSNHQTGSYMYSAASDNNLLQAQSNLNMWPSGSQGNSPLYYHKKFADPAEGYNAADGGGGGLRGPKALSQPQLNIGEQSNRNTQQHVVSLLPAPVDGTDSDDGGFRQHSSSRANLSMPNGSGSRSTPQQPAYIQNYRHNHAQQQQQQQHQQQSHQQHHMSYQQALHNAKQRAALESASNSNIQVSSYNTHTTVTVGDHQTASHHHHHQHPQSGESAGHQKHTISVDINSVSSVNVSTTGQQQQQSDSGNDAGGLYDKNGNHSSNIDSGRGSSSMATATGEAVMEKSKTKSDSEWVSVHKSSRKKNSLTQN
uniref:Uncharacterized protein n=1 Tax=Anopheles atroparvus TaxID=41427 RepID=A0A182JJL3_ANOAO